MTTAEEHLRRADPVLAAIMDEVVAGGEAPTLAAGHPEMPLDHYGVLVRAIAGQNISNIAARAIYRKLTERYDGRLPTPEEVLAENPDELRTAAGLSHAKTASLRSLAEHIRSGAVDLDRLHELPDAAVITQLTAVKGIGGWTADLFLIFHLHRPDVLPVGDLELRKVVERRYKLAKPPTPAEFERIGQPWRPHRTLACRYLWRLRELV
ncbi:DNA-3-methyladenine glycosylase family protein [Labedaea rhizosphaerae]|uniref:DNA-3-methyladenine glycosylase II n=1 Tax=Labedaea rhizosphaerae TaxID=598644 RepID=A0A4V3CYM9_LABRH|nr:DNA-3-methyladenine glycosylase [Labedaea rhizosphaerae]TDP94788.1 DNA-3-methyladenine glycosylase II [Labedaea rhizosphaerae]